MEQDLPKFHTPASRFAFWPTTAKEWEQYQLTDQQIVDFERQGYLAGIQVP